MQTAKNIKLYIDATRENIKHNEELKKELYNLDERRAAAAAGDREKHADLIKAFKENETKIKAVEDLIYKGKITLKFLYDNYKVAIVTENKPVITAVLEKYNNKPYGEKTKKKIHDEILTAGGFHIFISKDEISIRFPEDYYNAIIINAEYNNPFITAENRINTAALENAKPREKFTENPVEATEKLINAYNKTRNLLNDLNAAMDEYNEIKPAGLDHLYTSFYLYDTIL